MKDSPLPSTSRRQFVVLLWASLGLLSALAGYAVWLTTSRAFGPGESGPVLAAPSSEVTVVARVTPTSRVVRLVSDASVDVEMTPTSSGVDLASVRETSLTARLVQPALLLETTQTTTSVPRDLVLNGTFEDGLTHWYIEDSVSLITSQIRGEASPMLGISTGGGYADQHVAVDPGAICTLTGRGRVTVAGETGTLGVVFRNAAGDRLRDLEPTPIMFTETQFTESVLVFTIPAGVVDVWVYSYKESGAGQFEVDSISINSVTGP